MVCLASEGESGGGGGVALQLGVLPLQSRSLVSQASCSDGDLSAGGRQE